MKKKKKACCLKCSPARLGLYRSRLTDLRDYIFVDDPEMADILIIASGKYGLTDDQKELIEKYEDVLPLSVISEELLLEGDPEKLEKWIPDERDTVLPEDQGYELEL